MCKLIGLTGPTGSGKGVVAAAWADCGAVVLNADEYARAIVFPDSPCLRELVSAFSADILQPDGTLDRAKLAAHAFASPEATQTLNRITHPVICAQMEADARARFADGAKIVVFDSPLLFEAGQDRLCDRTVAVLADKETRLSRIMARDGLTREAAERRIAAQPSDDFYKERADAVWQNDHTVDRIIRVAKEWLLCL